MEFACVVFQVHDDGDYPLGIDNLPNVIEFCIIPFLEGFVLYVELKIAVDEVSSSWFP